MESTVEKLESRVRLIFRDLSVYRQSLGFHSSRVASASAHISNLLEELQRTQDCIARRRAAPLSMESVPESLLRGVHGTRSHLSLREASVRRVPASSPSRIITPERTSSPDTRCYETILDLGDLVTDQMLDADGFLEYPASGSQSWRTSCPPTPSLRSHELSGGPDTD